MTFCTFILKMQIKQLVVPLGAIKPLFEFETEKYEKKLSGILKTRLTLFLNLIYNLLSFLRVCIFLVLFFKSYILKIRMHISFCPLQKLP